MTKKQRLFQQISIKNRNCETGNFCIFLIFLLTTIALLIAGSIYFCMIKYKANQKHSLPYYITKNKVKEVLESNDGLKEINIKNRLCYYSDDIIKTEDFNLDNILIDEKSFENILIYNISYKPLSDAKPLRIRFDKIDGFIRVYDGIII